jgi:hypothetical protein
LKETNKKRRRHERLDDEADMEQVTSKDLEPKNETEKAGFRAGKKFCVLYCMFGDENDIFDLDPEGDDEGENDEKEGEQGRDTPDKTVKRGKKDVEDEDDDNEEEEEYDDQEKQGGDQERERESREPTPEVDSELARPSGRVAHVRKMVQDFKASGSSDDLLGWGQPLYRKGVSHSRVSLEQY